MCPADIEEGKRFCRRIVEQQDPKSFSSQINGGMAPARIAQTHPFSYKAERLCLATSHRLANILCEQKFYLAPLPGCTPKLARPLRKEFLELGTRSVKRAQWSGCRSIRRRDAFYEGQTSHPAV